MVNESGQGIRVRIISLPKFSETGELVLVDAETLEAEVIRFNAFDEVTKNS
jgi:DNA polymerase delta subunit 2